MTILHEFTPLQARHHRANLSNALLETMAECPQDAVIAFPLGIDDVNTLWTYNALRFIAEDYHRLVRAEIARQDRARAARAKQPITAATQAASRANAAQGRAILEADPEKKERRNRAGAKNLKNADPEKKAKASRKNLEAANAARAKRRHQ